MKPEFDYSSFCLNCIHETVCHSVADGLVYVPGFTCNDRELCAPAGTIERAYFIKENGEIVLIPLDRLILNRKIEAIKQKESNIEIVWHENIDEMPKAQHILVCFKWDIDDYEVVEIDPVFLEPTKKQYIVAWAHLPEYKEKNGGTETNDI